MKRLVVLGSLLAVGAVACAVGNPEEAAAPNAAATQEEMSVGLEQVRNNLYVLSGGGGNTAALIGTDGVTLVDTKLPGWGQPLLDAVAGLTDLPVTTIINTHTHFDHVGGNVEFPAGVEVVAHETTAALMREMRPVYGLQDGPQANLFRDNEGRGLATRTYSDTLTLGSGDEQVDLHHFGRAHTGGDTWVVFPALGVMHGGDAFLGKMLPILDANNNGSGLAFPDTVAAAVEGASGIDTIITGHSTLMTVADLEEFGDFNRAILDRIRAGKQDGQSVDAILSTWELPERFAEYQVPEGRLRTNVALIFSELP
jgi:glyoxylase-like metal-dependent hydrolase (beta-lactamase superfamily II)